MKNHATARSMAKRPVRGLRRGLLALVCVALVLSGCQQVPKEYNGRPVVGAKWVNGRLIYELGPLPGDREEIKRIASEGEEAAAEVRFSSAGR